MDELPAWIERAADDEDWNEVVREGIRDAFCERLQVTSLATDGEYVYASPWGKAHITTTVASALSNLVYDIEREQQRKASGRG
jgi:hypothetical protein